MNTKRHELPVMKSHTEAAGEGRPHLLPNDLANSLTFISDQDFKILASAVDRERNRRQKALDGPEPAESPTRVRQKPYLTSSQNNPRDPQPLTKARINALRAAIKAGVKPTALVRQFGISLTTLQHALTADREGKG